MQTVLRLELDASTILLFAALTRLESFISFSRDFLSLCAFARRDWSEQIDFLSMIQTF